MKLYRILTAGLALLLCLSAAACSDPVEPPVEPTVEPTPEETPESEQEVETKTETVYIYETKYVDFAFVSPEKKAEWLEPLTRLLDNRKVPFYNAEEDLIDYEILYPDRPCIEYGHQLGLFDVDADGTPELLVDLGGGSAGNAFYAVYDIYTGAKLGHLDGGHSQSWHTYFNKKSGKYESFGQFEWRIGWSGQTRFLHQAVITDTYASPDERIYSHEVLSAYYQIDVTKGEGDTSGSYVESGTEFYPGVSFRVDGSRASLRAYFDRVDEFAANYVRISETGLCLLYWSEVTDEDDDVATCAAKMAAALLATEQEFVAPLAS